MEPQPKTETRPTSRIMTTTRRSEQKPYRSRIERSLPVEFRVRGAPRQEEEFNISQITVNRSENDISMTDTIDRRIEEIHKRKSSKKFNGTASFQKFVKNETGSSQNSSYPSESTKPSIQFTIPTVENPKVQTMELKKQTMPKKQENFLTMREKNSSLAWNRKLN